jgi:NAD+ synthase
LKNNLSNIEYLRSASPLFSISGEEIVERLKKQIIQYSNQQNNPKYIMGLSGGVDSAVVAYLINYSLGAGNLITLNLPYFNSDPGILRAREVAKSIGNKHIEISIKSLIDNEIDTLNKFQTKEGRIKKKPYSISEKIRLGNLASRIRIGIFYDFARSYNGLVLGTANKVEYLLGYVTKWGTPLSYDYGILNDLYKYQIYKIAKALKVPSNIIKSIPTTGFYLKQTHEHEIGIDLFKLDLIIFLKFEKKLTDQVIINKYGIDKESLAQVMNLHDKNKHKLYGNQQYARIKV